jgi:hypothetical protein
VDGLRKHIESNKSTRRGGSTIKERGAAETRDASVHRLK